MKIPRLAESALRWMLAARPAISRGIMLGLAFGLLAMEVPAQATPVGVWRTIHDETNTEKSLVRITEKEGVFSGRIEKLLDPAIKPEAVCGKCSDERKDKPLLGLVLIKGVRHKQTDPARWDGGEILDPNDGKTYALRLTPSADGKTLAVRAYIATPIMGRTQTWIRLE